jgi:chromosome partitioning protein
MIVVVAALKGGVGKTTTSVYLSAVAAASRRPVTLIDADAQASAAEWIEQAEGERLETVTVVEAPTGRLLTRALDRIDEDAVGIVDSPPGNERLLESAMAAADCIVVPTRVGGVETARAEEVFAMVPRKTPAGLVICSARTYTRDYQDAMSGWREAQIPVWGTVPERVTIAAGPDDYLAADGLDSYRAVWRRALRSVREP